MKKLGIWLFIVFFSVATVYAILQSEIGKNFVRNLLTQSLEQSGFKVQIRQIEGTLPHQLDLKGITLDGEGLQVTIQELKLRPVLWRLLKKEIAFTDIHAKAVSLQKSAPFDFEGKFRMNQRRAILQGNLAEWTFSARLDKKEKTAHFTAKNDLLNVKGNASFTPDFTLSLAHLQIGSDKVLSKLPFSASGRFLANAIFSPEGKGYKGRVSWHIPNLRVDQVKIGPVKGKGEVLWQEQTLKGQLTAEPFAKTNFNLTFRPDSLIAGTCELDVDNLQSLHIPNIYGKLHAKALFEIADAVQELHLDAEATHFYYQTFFAQKVSLYSDLKDPFKNPSGLVDLAFEKAKWNDLELETVSLQTSREPENWPFRIFAEGRWKHPLEIRMSGDWQNPFSANIQHFTGTFYNHPFALIKPVQLALSKDSFHLSDTEIEIAGAKAFVSIDRQKEQTRASLRFDQLPLDMLSLNPLDVSVTGYLDLQAHLKEQNGKLEGDLKAAIQQMEVASLGISDKMNAAGSFEGHFNRDLLQLKGDLLVDQAPLLNLDISLPIYFSVWPFQAELLTHKDGKGQIALQGRIENFLDFFDLGPHRLEGECKGVLRFSNTLYRPLVEGTLLFQNGFYQNYYTGTQLHNMQAEFFAEKNKVYLRSLTAQDASQAGTLKAEGQIHLLQSDHYPFFLDASFENLRFAEIDLVSAVSTGKVHLEGNSISALAKGDIRIIQSELSIPDHIPRPLPNLQVVYRNPIHPVPPVQTQYRPYPLFLDLHVSAPEAVTISGRGLNSEWKGQFHLGGTYTSLSTKGKLELISGEFNFSSRSFKLIDGSLSLSGIEHEMPYLNLAGSMETKGITIVARLKGPLNDPQITLQSTPPLPLGSIMSYLLFGQDVSEIGGFQALQLATSLASLAGTGPDVMESTRRSLGVDRLRVITDPTEEGGETVALQVGKYVSEGVLVSFTQGTEESSTNISVEIELKNNFVFQIESDQHQEQGKFTLKWNLNY